MLTFGGLASDLRAPQVAMNERSDTQSTALKWQLGSDSCFGECFELHPEAMWVYDEATLQVLAVNLAALQLYGYSRQDFLSRALPEIQPQFPRDANARAARHFLLSHEGVWEHVKSDRTPVELDVTSCAVDFKGKPARLVLVQKVGDNCQVETASRRMRKELEERVQARTADLETANEALVESQERFRQLAENIRDVFWLSNLAMTRIIYISPAYQEIWGRPCHELYQSPHSWFESIHAEDRARVRRLFHRPIPERGYEHTYRVVRPDGSTRWVLERGFPVRNHVGELYRLVGIARDITERKELETEILAISEREQRRIGQDLHDDLCQQLVGIEFLSKALQQQLKLSPQAAQAGEIAQLIREAIEHTRLLARGLAPLPLEAEGLMEGLRSLAARCSRYFGLECAFLCPNPALIHDVTVATYLYRIAQEAVTNAIKHAQARVVEIRLSAGAESLRLTIQDDGVGFAEPKRSFSGMGLRIMQYRADVIGAHFMIETGPGAGTAVLCTVPIGALKAPAPSREFQQK